MYISWWSCVGACGISLNSLVGCLHYLHSSLQKCVRNFFYSEWFFYFSRGWGEIFIYIFFRLGFLLDVLFTLHKYYRACNLSQNHYQFIYFFIFLASHYSIWKPTTAVTCISKQNKIFSQTLFSDSTLDDSKHIPITHPMSDLDVSVITILTSIKTAFVLRPCLFRLFRLLTSIFPRSEYKNNYSLFCNPTNY